MESIGFALPTANMTCRWSKGRIDFSFHVHKRSCDDVYTGSCDEHAGSRQDGGVGASVWRAADKQGLVGQKHYLQ